MKKSNYNNVIVYCIWINGRASEDVDQHYPIDSNLEDERVWTNDFKKTYKDFYSAKSTLSKFENDNCFQDYIVQLFSLDIDIDKFEKEYGLKFNINKDEVQESIAYFVNFNFNLVCERIVKFKN